MTLEIKILRGARAGERLDFDRPIVSIGRQPGCDLQFDPLRDLDVSGEHAELRQARGGWSIVDRGSTNGTFVNGTRINVGTIVHPGDTITFGANGPAIELAFPTDDTSLASSQGARRPTGERVAVAVNAQMRRVWVVAGVVIVVIAAAAAIGISTSRQESARQIATLRTLLAETDSQTARIQAAQGSIHDTAITAQLERERDSLKALVTSVNTSPNRDADVKRLQQAFEARLAAQRQMEQIDRTGISQRNDSAVALIVTEIGGQRYGGTAFSVTRSGLMVTNRHNVRDSAGTMASRITVEFANTNRHISARLVKLADDTTADLALVQLTEINRYPVIAGISKQGVTQAGAGVVAIGFPESFSLPMEGDTVKTSLIAGTVSKVTSGVLQLDVYASHGSSGTPVFDGSGNAIGVIFGGEANSHGRIIYAVPSSKVAALLADRAPEILR